MLPVVACAHAYHGARKGERMIRSAKRLNAGNNRQIDVQDVEREFLGVFMDLARLREKVLALAARLTPPTSPSCSP